MTFDYTSGGLGYSSLSASHQAVMAHMQMQQAAMLAGGFGSQQTAPFSDLPDETVFGELSGWRCWNVIQTPEGWRLRSITMTTIWASGLCGPDQCERNSAEVKSNYVAGYYAFKTKEEMFEGMGLGFDVYGEVLLYGEAVEFKKGYHAEYCRIVALYPNPHSLTLKPPPRQRGFAAWLARKSRERDGHPSDKISLDLYDFYIGDKKWISDNQLES
jgi:hypothetical protein